MTLSQVRGATVDSATASEGSWADQANAVDGTYGSNDATYSVWNDAGRNKNATFDVGGFDGSGKFGDIPGGATVNSVTVYVRHIESNTSDVDTFEVSCWDGGTQIGSTQTGTRSTSAATETITAFSPTVAQLQSASFFIRGYWARSNNTNSTDVSLDYIDVQVDYTGGGSTNAPAGNASGAGAANAAAGSVAAAAGAVAGVGGSLFVDASAGKNLVTENIATGTDTAQATTGFTAVNSTLTSDVSDSTEQLRSLRVTYSAVNPRWDAYGGDSSGSLAVTGGQTYRFQMQARSPTSTATLNLQVFFWQSDGVTPCSPTASQTEGSALASGWALVGGDYSLPSDCAKVSLRAYANLSAAEYFLCDEVGVWAGTSTDWELPGSGGGRVSIGGRGGSAAGAGAAGDVSVPGLAEAPAGAPAGVGVGNAAVSALAVGAGQASEFAEVV